MEGDEGYPYSGFYGMNSCYDVLYENCVMTGHKAYRTLSNGTMMGSYDISLTLAANVTYKGCIQSNNIDDTNYWGVMGSNFGRNITYDGCTLSRFDAHEGMYNAYIKNTTIGHTVSLIGGGEAVFENTTKTGGTAFISFRGDYGSLWRGDVILKNCEHKAYQETTANAVCSPNSYYSTIDIFDMGWKQHDFGYRCYMPQNITVENFKVGSTVSTIRMFSYSVSSSCVTNSTNPLVVTKTVTYKNQSKSITLNSSYLDSVVTKK
jgi:hypothetical protein